jgi:hypothetical protein
MEGPDSVPDDLARDDLDVGAVFKPRLLDGVLDPWFDFKRNLNSNFGLQLQFSYQALYQQADSSPGEDEAAAGRFEFNGMWTLLGRKGKNPGMVTVRVENRERLGTDIPPTKLGQQFGSGSLTGTGFSDFEWALSELAWRQTVMDGRMRFGFGKISATSWYNAHPLSGSKSGFQNSALQSSATKPFPGRGIGSVAGGEFSDSFVVIGGIHDANAKTQDSPFDTIDEVEFYYSVEGRWFPTSYDRRRWDQVRVQAWYQQERDKAGIPAGQGITFLASRLFNDFYMPFAYGGISDGDASTMEADLTAGIGFGFNTAHRAARDFLAFAVNWGKPSDSSFQEQWTSELFYRFQLVQNIAITPSVQYIVDPQRDPDVKDAWIGSVRGRVTF